MTIPSDSYPNELLRMNLPAGADDWTPTPHGKFLAQVLAEHNLVRGFDVLELGAGVGNHTVVLARQGAKSIVATEITAELLETTRTNVALNVPDVSNIEYRVADWLATEGSFDVIVSNPPYVARADEASLPPELAHEPEMALFAGTDGLDVIRRLINDAGNHLKAGGWLGIELSPEQADEVEGLLKEAGFTDVERRFDLASRPRVVGARWP